MNSLPHEELKGMHRESLLTRTRKPLVTLMKQGATPEMLTLSLACGLTIGSFPLLGTTTAICTGLALAFRLNLPVMLLGNFIVYPLQLALIVPFIILGERLFGSGAAINPHDFALLLRADVLKALRLMSGAAIRAALAWALVAPVAVLGSYLVLLPVLRRIGKRVAGEGGAGTVP